MKMRVNARRFPAFSDPTPERMAKIDPGWDRSKKPGPDDGWGVGNAARRITLELPLVAALRQNWISGRQFAAGEKFNVHWHRGGLVGVRAFDLNRVSGGGGGNTAFTDDRKFHADRIADAIKVVGQKAASTVLIPLLCEPEIGFADVGARMGHGNRPQAVAAARAAFSMALDLLADLWSI